MAREVAAATDTVRPWQAQRGLTRLFVVERVKGIEPSLSAWENRLSRPARSAPVSETGPELRIRSNAIRLGPGSDG